MLTASRHRPSPVRSRPIEVLVVSPPTSLWGAQLRLLDYVAPLAERGLRVTLGSPADGEFHAAWKRRGLPHLELAVPHLAGIRDPATGRRPPPPQLAAIAGSAVRGAAAVAAAVRRFDVAWSFNLRAHPFVVPVGRVRRVPVVIEIVDIVRPGAGQRLLRLCARHADATIVNSAATGAALGGRGRNVHIIHPGVDTTRFHPGEPTPAIRRQLTDDGGVLIGIVGRVDPMKGVHLLVDAMARVPDELDARLVVIGDVGVSSGEYAREIAARAERLLGPRARFVGRRHDIPEVLRNLDLLVNASPAEPFGRSALEAQASGLAVIGTRQGGIPEFVDHGETGLLVPPGDVAALATAITELAGDPQRRADLGQAARASAVARFDVNERYDLVADVVGGVVDR
jgi:glycosyltransferase involved in cell wall biosynthesis